MTKAELRLLAEAASKAASVTRVAEGARAYDLTDKEWAKAVRSDRKLSDVEDDGANYMQQAREANGYYKS